MLNIRKNIFRKLVIASLVLFILTMPAFAVYYIVDWENYKKFVQQRVNDVMGNDLTLSGGIDINIYPSLTIKVNDIKIQSPNHDEVLMEADYAVIEYGWGNLLIGDNSIKSLILKDVTATVDFMKEKKSNWLMDLDFVSDKNGIKEKKHLRNLSDIKINGLHVVLKTGDKDRPAVSQAYFDKAHFVSDYETHMNFDASYDVGNNILDKDLKITYNLSSNANKNMEFRFIDGATDVAFNGHLDAKNNRLEGDLKSTIANPVIVLGDFMGIDSKWLVEKTMSEDILKLDAKLSVGEGFVRMDNAFIESEYIKANGDLEFADSSKIKIQAEILDLDMLTKETVDSAYAAIRNQIPRIRFSAPGQRLKSQNRAKFDISVSSPSVIFNGQELSLSNLEVKSNEEGIVISNMQMGSLPGGVSVNITNKNTKSSGDEKISEVKIEGKNLLSMLKWLGLSINLEEEYDEEFGLYCDIIFEKNALHIKKFDLKSGDISAVGQVYFDIEDSLKMRLALNSNIINLDVFSIKDEEVDDLSLGSASYDWLRNIEDYLDQLVLSLAADKLVYRDKIFSDAKALITIDDGIMKVTGLDVKSEMGKILGSFKLDATDLKPKIEIFANIEKLTSAFVSEYFKMDEYNEERRAKRQYIDKHWSEMPLDFSFMELFTGRGKIYIDTYEHNKNLTLRKFQSDLQFNGGNIKIEKFKATAFGNEIQGEGNIGVIQPSINLVATIASAEVRPTLKALLGYTGINGYYSASTSLSMVGNSLYDWVNSLQGSVSFVTRGFNVNGFDLGLLSRKIPYLKEIRDIRYWSHKALNSGYTPFTFASGVFSILKGQAKSTSLQFGQKNVDTGNVKVAIDIPAQAIDLKANFGVKPSLPISMTINGDIDRPFSYWDYKGIEKYWERKFYGR